MIPIIILTGLNDETIESYAIKEGAHDFLVKGQTEGRLLECIKQCSSERNNVQVNVRKVCPLLFDGCYS